MHAIYDTFLRFVAATRPMAVDRTRLHPIQHTHTITSVAASVGIDHQPHTSTYASFQEPATAHERLMHAHHRPLIDNAWGEVCEQVGAIAPLLRLPGFQVRELCGPSPNGLADHGHTWWEIGLWDTFTHRSDTPQDLAAALVRLAEGLRGLPSGQNCYLVHGTNNAGDPATIWADNAQHAQAIWTAIARITTPTATVLRVSMLTSYA